MTKFSLQNLNSPWVKALDYHKDLILKNNAIRSIKDFLELQGANFPILPIPLVISQDSYNELCAAAKLLISSQTKIIKILLKQYSQDELLDFFNLPMSIKPFIDWHELKKGEKVIGRFDILPSKNGFYFCEINADPAVNGLKLFDSMNKFARIMQWSFVHNSSSPRKNIAEYLRNIVLKHNFKTIVFLAVKFYIHEGSGTINSLFQFVKEYIPEVEVLLADENSYPQTLLNPKKGANTLIYRMGFYRDLNCDELILNIFKSGATMINTFESEIRSNKKWMAIFQDPNYYKYLTEQEQANIFKYIPLTFNISNNLENFLSKKEDYVFKKNISYGGLDVLMGSEHDVDKIKNIISNSQNWIVQKRIPIEDIFLPENELFEIKPFKIVLGLFFVENNYSGMLVRASSNKSIVNVTYGGASMGWAYPVSSEELDYSINQLHN